MTRTDIHAPSHPNFDPQAYTLYGCWDLRPEWPGESQARIETVRQLIAQGYRFGSSAGASHCGHCGQAIRFAALLARQDVREMIYVGEQCLDNRFDLTKSEFDALRKTATLNSERRTRLERIAQLCIDNPGLAVALQSDSSEFLADLRDRLLTKGELSPKQIAAAIRVAAENAQRAADRAAREQRAAALAASGLQAPEGRVEVLGTVVARKLQESRYGVTAKMIVEAPDGWRVWATVPRALDNAQVGAQVRFTATLERSDRDPLFAFALRPTKAAFA